MLTATQPMQLSAFWQAIAKIFASTGHGSATYTVGEDRQLIHDQTQLSFVIGQRETPEAFIDRVRAQGEPGDMIELTMRGGALASAKITRKAELPLPELPLPTHAGEPVETYVDRLKSYKGQHPQA